MDSSGLPQPVVPADLYDEKYYLERCMGHEQWVESGGASAAGTYQHILERFGFGEGQTLVDVGTGRGEMLATAVDLGAERAIGLEYSAAAVKLAQTTLEKRKTGPKASILLADARSAPVEDGIADMVSFVDVVEHLTGSELARALEEARRMLRPGGRVVVHTAPNRYIYTVTYRLLRLPFSVLGKRWPKDPRSETEREMHVNEQTRRSLGRALRRGGFADTTTELGTWVYTGFVPSRAGQDLLRRLAARKPTAWLAVTDLWAVGTKPVETSSP